VFLWSVSEEQIAAPAANQIITVFVKTVPRVRTDIFGHLTAEVLVVQRSFHATSLSQSAAISLKSLGLGRNASAP
jgi:hypothetical protein